MAANPDKISEPVSQNERAATRVARLIVKEIQERGLRPGAKLDSEHIMIEKYGVARATIREALRFLELQGVLRIKAGPGGGPVVSVPDVDHLTSAVSLQLQFANATFESVLEARRSIYPVLVREAAQHATHQDIVALRQCVQSLQDAASDSEATTRESRRFYEMVATASKTWYSAFWLMHYIACPRERVLSTKRNNDWPMPETRSAFWKRSSQQMPTKHSRYQLKCMPPQNAIGKKCARAIR